MSVATSIKYYSLFTFHYSLTIILADEEHLAILRKCPYLVINLSLELVDVVTDLIHKWLYGIVVCDSLLTLRLNLVSYAT